MTVLDLFITTNPDYSDEVCNCDTEKGHREVGSDLKWQQWWPDK